MDTTLSVLDRTREILENEGNWTQLELGRDEIGLGCDPLSDDACSWCLIGALTCACEEVGEPGDYNRAFERIRYELDGRDPSVWNDSRYREHHEVLGLLDWTIRGLEAASERR